MVTLCLMLTFTCRHWGEYSSHFLLIMLYGSCNPNTSFLDTINIMKKGNDVGVTTGATHPSPYEAILHNLVGLRIQLQAYISFLRRLQYFHLYRGAV